jgi:hypothetical protein
VAGASGSAIRHTGYSSEDAVAASPSVRRGELPAGLNRSGVLLLSQVTGREQVSLGELADVLVGHYGLPRERALADVATFVQHGQVAGLLSFHAARGNRVKGHARFVADLVMMPVRGGMHLPSIQRRYYPYSAMRMVIASAGAQLRLGLLVVVVCVIPLSFIDGFWSNVGAATVVGGFAAGVIGGLVVLGVIHEAAHAVVSTVWGSRPKAVYLQGMRVGLRRTRLTPTRDVLVAVAGPVVGAVAGATVLNLLLEVDRSAPTTLARAAMVGLLIATSFQVACLVPPAADGVSILASLRRLRQGWREAKETVT